MEQTKKCTACGAIKPLSAFYKSSSHAKGVMCYCRNCFNKSVVKRWIQRKKEAIAYKGSQCQKCGLHVNQSHYAVFEFHHINKSSKDWNWSKLRLKTWSAIKEELDKCQLLCANCHRIAHSEDFPDQPGSRR